MSITLYQAADSLAAQLDLIDENGELPEGYESAHALVASKAASVAAYIAQREMEADAVEARLKEVQTQIRSARRRAEYLRKYLAEHMARTGITSIQSEDKLLSIKLYPQRDESVEVFDEKQIPGEWIRIKTVEEPNKSAIKEALRAGHDIPGCRIVKRDRLVIG